MSYEIMGEQARARNDCIRFWQFFPLLRSASPRLRTLAPTDRIAATFFLPFPFCLFVAKNIHASTCVCSLFSPYCWSAKRLPLVIDSIFPPSLIFIQLEWALNADIKPIKIVYSSSFRARLFFRLAARKPQTKHIIRAALRNNHHFRIDILIWVRWPTADGDNGRARMALFYLFQNEHFRTQCAALSAVRQLLPLRTNQTKRTQITSLSAAPHFFRTVCSSISLVLFVWHFLSHFSIPRYWFYFIFLFSFAAFIREAKTLHFIQLFTALVYQQRWEEIESCTVTWAWARQSEERGDEICQRAMAVGANDNR